MVKRCVRYVRSHKYEIKKCALAIGKVSLVITGAVCWLLLAGLGAALEGGRHGHRYY